jgi:hypothetical protein
MNLMQIARRVIHAGVLLALVRGSARADIYIVPAPSWSLSEWVSRSDAVCLAKWVSSSTPNAAGYRDVCLEVVAILKGPPRSVRKGERFDFRLSVYVDKDALFLLFGDHEPSRRDINWDAPKATTRACFDYIAQAPGPASDSADQPQKLLPYLVKFVDTQDRFIRSDMIQELKDARVEDLRSAIPAMPRDKLRKLLVAAETSDELPGLACYLLGFCGTRSLGVATSGTASSGAASSGTAGDDLKLLERKVREKNRDDGFRLGVDYMIIGYLMLAGEAGLDRLDVWKIKDRSAPFGETYNAMQALRFMWDHGDGRITRDRLIKSMRLFLDRPELADIAIHDLRRWRDWNSLDRIAGLYGQGPFNEPIVKRAIIRYLYSCSESKPTTVRPEQAAAAKRFLAEIRHKDPQRVAEVDRNRACLSE